MLACLLPGVLSAQAQRARHFRPVRESAPTAYGYNAPGLAFVADPAQQWVIANIPVLGFMSQNGFFETVVNDTGWSTPIWSSSAQPVQYSTDGGNTWTTPTLPATNAWTTIGSSGLQPGFTLIVQLLPGQTAALAIDDVVTTPNGGSIAYAPGTGPAVKVAGAPGILTEGRIWVGSDSGWTDCQYLLSVGAAVRWRATGSGSGGVVSAVVNCLAATPDPAPAGVLVVDGVPQAPVSVPEPAGGTMFELVQFGDVPADTLTHEYVLLNCAPSLFDPILQLETWGIMCSGATMQTTALIPRPVWAVLGDSISQGSTMTPTALDQHWLQLAIDNDVALLDMARAGTLIADPWFPGTAIPTIQSSPTPPTKVFVSLGFNDLFNQRTQSEITSDYETLLTQVLAAVPGTAQVYCLGIFDNGIDTLTALPTGDAGIRAAVQAVNAPNAAFADVSGFLSVANTTDGVHPASAGGLQIAANLEDITLALAYTAAGPGVAIVGEPIQIDLSLEPIGAFAGGVTVRLSDNGAGGSFSGNSPTLTTHSPAATITYTPSIAGTITLSLADGATGHDPSPLTILSTTASLKGTVALQGIAPFAPAQPVAFVFTPASGPPTTVTASIDATGAFAFTGVAPGAYTVHIKGAKWLQRDLQVVVQGTSAATASVTLLSGDVNNDNVVDLSDFSELAAAFGAASGDSNWDANADLNCDGLVDLTDFGLLAANFGLQGDP
jgi:lysophospholipase L1-like esterase